MLNSAPDVRVREMRQEDLEQVFAIEEAAKAFPWSKEMLQQELYLGEASRPLVAEVQNKIAAFVMAWVCGR
ncbi:MAG: hypothetical protein D6814_00230 [Calditrichaeota bacterium]|nr:MAG: hypothetical protein D6814_00230 [Calditrichota bacterium]